MANQENDINELSREIIHHARYIRNEIRIYKRVTKINLINEFNIKKEFEAGFSITLSEKLKSTLKECNNLCDNLLKDIEKMELEEIEKKSKISFQRELLNEKLKSNSRYKFYDFLRINQWDKNTRFRDDSIFGSYSQASYRGKEHYILKLP